jgi:hypothetical protein
VTGTSAGAGAGTATTAPIASWTLASIDLAGRDARVGRTPRAWGAGSAAGSAVSAHASLTAGVASLTCRAARACAALSAGSHAAASRSSSANASSATAGAPRASSAPSVGGAASGPVAGSTGAASAAAGEATPPPLPPRPELPPVPVPASDLVDCVEPQDEIRAAAPMPARRTISAFMPRPRGQLRDKAILLDGRPEERDLSSDFRCPTPGCRIDVSRTDLSHDQGMLHILSGCACWSASCCHRRPPCDHLLFWRWSLSRSVCRATPAAEGQTEAAGRPAGAVATRAELAARRVARVGPPRAVRGESTTQQEAGVVRVLREERAGRAGRRLVSRTACRAPAPTSAAPSSARAHASR